jgi:hypothetical protein
VFCAPIPNIYECPVVDFLTCSQGYIEIGTDFSITIIFYQSAVNYGLNRDDVKKAITIHLKEDRRGFSDLQLLINASLALAKSRKEGFKE